MSIIGLIAAALWFLGAFVLASAIRWFGKLVRKIGKGNYSLAMKHVRKLEARLRQQANNGDMNAQSLLDDIAHMYDELADQIDDITDNLRNGKK